MDNNTNSNKVEQVAEEVVSYVNLRVESVKLAMVEHLSTLSSNGLAILLAILFVAFALLLFTFAFVYWFGQVVGSFVLAAVLTGAFFLIIGLTTYLLRNKFFVNQMVGMFSKMFFPQHNHKPEYEEDEQ